MTVMLEPELTEDAGNVRARMVRPSRSSPARGTRAVGSDGLPVAQRARCEERVGLGPAEVGACPSGERAAKRGGRIHRRVSSGGSSFYSAMLVTTQ